MTRKVVSVRLDAPIGDTIRLMLDNRISGLPVVDGDSKVIGILTEGDLLRRAETGNRTPAAALARIAAWARSARRRICPDPRAEGRRDHDRGRRLRGRG